MDAQGCVRFGGENKKVCGLNKVASDVKEDTDVCECSDNEAIIGDKQDTEVSRVGKTTIEITENYFSASYDRETNSWMATWKWSQE